MGSDSHLVYDHWKWVKFNRLVTLESLYLRDGTIKGLKMTISKEKIIKNQNLKAYLAYL